MSEMVAKPSAHAERTVSFLQPNGSEVPFRVFSSQEVYDREQERIFRGATWSFLGLEAEIPNVYDFKSTFIGDTPVVVTRTPDGLSCWVNRCAHRGAQVCRELRGNARSHACVYHQWGYSAKGDLLGVPFRRGQNGMAGMPADFKTEEHGLQQVRVASYRGLVFGTFRQDTPSLEDYIGPMMRPWIDRIFHKPVVYLGCTRQYSKSNWKLYLENVKDGYHASLLHLFHTTFNIYRVGMKVRQMADVGGLHSLLTSTKPEVDTNTAAAYEAQKVRTMNNKLVLEDPTLLGQIQEYEEITTNNIQAIFPQLVIQQIHNTLAARQLLPKGPNNFELIFHFFGYEDDTPELRELRLLQANLVGPAGYISMEDTEATELVQRATRMDPDSHSYIAMAQDVPEETDSSITEYMIRRFWTSYQALMGY
ncbi:MULTISPECIES: anthranilate 1,2-dioxygenase large subunit AndAc [Pseudomonadota]|jgi:anthranilate 1,2-dioxygenase large subunit|uniref:Anthranilate 1,2-dioxygenase large subunit n=5 Tax=Pseudomonadota TaxID=1224 RepID=A0A024HJ36_PSEKB|nr:MULTISPECIES: anthranilate 1,2-dioxygenase large subunit AndAc [Pseudomonadota]ABE31844.1 ring hydroxylating dioxygenase, alpha subunit [Paraburkholderia xenovorans LB400]ANC47670.1 Rieske (2Fe-2S) protein [Pandoraea pnomenusa]MBO9332236.1 Rieske 2Fe-2S domain-containing protein [Achromobacter xylosoxidans]MCT9826918.1 Rieske 2Fe-2S domain-containing protein [Pseudomonas veronii]MDD2013171.1 Rieske 2Fe-2S domain-containing protein [Pseudomonas putida]